MQHFTPCYVLLACIAFHLQIMPLPLTWQLRRPRPWRWVEISHKKDQITSLSIHTSKLEGLASLSDRGIILWPNCNPVLTLELAGKSWHSRGRWFDKAKFFYLTKVSWIVRRYYIMLIQVPIYFQRPLPSVCRLMNTRSVYYVSKRSPQITTPTLQFNGLFVLSSRKTPLSSLSLTVCTQSWIQTELYIYIHSSFQYQLICPSRWFWMPEIL